MFVSHSCWGLRLTQIRLGLFSAAAARLLGFVLSGILLTLRVKFQPTRATFSDRRGHRDLLLSFTLQGCTCHISEGVFNVAAVERARLIKHHVVIFFCPTLSFGCGNLSRVSLIAFVAQTDKGESQWVTWACVLKETALPSVERLKRLLIGDIIRESAAVGTSVKCVAERLELFLASGVPNLQGDHGAVDEDFFLAEVCTDSGLGLPSDLAVQVLLQQCCLANT